MIAAGPSRLRRALLNVLPSRAAKTPRKLAAALSPRIESLESRRLLSVSLSGATNLGTLSGRKTFADSVNGSTNTADVRKFSFSASGTFSASLSGLSANADLALIKDSNNNGVVDTGETLATAAHTGTTVESISKSLSTGTYYVRTYSVGGATTNYTLALASDYAGNSLASARSLGTVLAARKGYADFVGTSDTNDFYKVSLGSTRTLTAKVAGAAQVQFIKDANANNTIDPGDTLATASPVGSSASLSRSLGAGFYFVRVLRATSDTNYTLTLNAPALNIVFDYSKDASGFFNAHTSAKDRLNDAALVYGDFTDSLAAIKPTSPNTWSEVFAGPGQAGGPQTTVVNPSVAANTLVVYVGGRSDLTGLELGHGGPGGWNASGTQSWLNTIRGRGQAGALANPATDYAPWGGAITFSSTANWNFNSANPTSTQNDFLTVATHELAHVLGIGTADSWRAKVSGTTFTGSHARTANGGVNPALDSVAAHFKQGTMSSVNGKTQEVVMDPALSVGQRRAFTKLDYAALADIGWQVPSSTGVTLVAGSTAATPSPTTTTSIQTAAALQGSSSKASRASEVKAIATSIAHDLFHSGTPIQDRDACAFAKSALQTLVDRLPDVTSDGIRRLIEDLV